MMSESVIILPENNNFHCVNISKNHIIYITDKNITTVNVYDICTKTNKYIKLPEEYSAGNEETKATHYEIYVTPDNQYAMIYGTRIYILNLETFDLNCANSYFDNNIVQGIIVASIYKFMDDIYILTFDDWMHGTGTYIVNLLTFETKYICNHAPSFYCYLWNVRNTLLIVDEFIYSDEIENQLKEINIINAITNEKIDMSMFDDQNIMLLNNIIAYVHNNKAYEIIIEDNKCVAVKYTPEPYLSKEHTDNTEKYIFDTEYESLTIKYIAMTPLPIKNSNDSDFKASEQLCFQYVNKSKTPYACDKITYKINNKEQLFSYGLNNYDYINGILYVIYATKIMSINLKNMLNNINIFLTGHEITYDMCDVIKNYL